MCVCVCVCVFVCLCLCVHARHDSSIEKCQTPPALDVSGRPPHLHDHVSLPVAEKAVFWAEVGKKGLHNPFWPIKRCHWQCFRMAWPQVAELFKEHVSWHDVVFSVCLISHKKGFKVTTQLKKTRGECCKDTVYLIRENCCCAAFEWQYTIPTFSSGFFNHTYPHVVCAAEVLRPRVGPSRGSKLLRRSEGQQANIFPIKYSHQRLD